MFRARKSGRLISPEVDEQKENKNMSFLLLGGQTVNMDEQDFLKLLFVETASEWLSLKRFC